ncbi:Zinc finger, CCHC-type [Sesbania bispinosa]|nr:Zinc finger, CCHC-type [Sesbania bispinosa]
MNRWKGVAFTEEEGAEVCVPEEVCLQDSDAWLVGRLAMQSTYNVRAFKNTIMNVWKPKHGMEIWEIGRNLFSFRFFNAKDRDGVLKESPWNFDRNLVVLKVMSPDENPKEEDLKEAHKDDHKLGHSIRVRVIMDIIKPLRRGMMIKKGDREAIKIFFKYDRLGNICYCCGELDHTMKDCEEKRDVDSDEEIDNLPYGPWLRESMNRSNGVVGRRRDDHNSGEKSSTKDSQHLALVSDEVVEKSNHVTLDAKEDQGKDAEVALIGGAQPVATLISTHTHARTEAKEDQGKDAEVALKGGAQPVAILNSPHTHAKSEGGNNPHKGKSWKRRARDQNSSEPNKDTLVEAVIWKNTVGVSIASYSENHMSMEVKLIAEDITFLLSGVYGYPENRNKDKTWQLMKELKPAVNTPWLCVGDFNEVLCVEDKMGGNPVDIQSMLSFKSTLVECDLCDLGFVGYRYTWSNGRPEPDCIEERLDRALGNCGWKDLWNDVMVSSCSRHMSDHSPILIETSSGSQIKRERKKGAVNSPPPGNCELVMVADSIEEGRKAWNREVIFDTFTANVAQQILSIPLLHSNNQDVLTWKWTRDKRYSVRSGYRFLMDKRIESAGSSSAPTAAEEENSVRPNLPIVWRGTRNNGACNTLLFLGGTFMVLEMVTRNIAVKPLKVSQQVVQQQRISWVRLEDNVYKANVDAAILKNSGAGLGAVFRNSQGEVMAAATHFIPHMLDPY